jgi:hypothetical protein
MRKAGKSRRRERPEKSIKNTLNYPQTFRTAFPPNLLLNIPPAIPETKISFVAPTAKPRLVHVSIKPTGKESFAIADKARTATDFVLHIEVGGLAGAIAPMIGKQPADFHIWILEGSSPAFIREEGQFYEGGPLWQIEQVSPTFSH